MRVFLLAIVFLLVGCTNIPPDYKIDSSQPVGLVVGSITYQTLLGRYSIQIQSTTSQKHYALGVGDAMWTPFSHAHEDGLDARGGTFAIEVPAGAYRIIRWDVSRGNRIDTSTQPIDIAFQVEQGKSTYLGNFDFNDDLEVSIKDESKRDLPLLRKRFEALQTSPLSYAIKESAVIEKIGGKYESGIDLMLFFPVPGRR